MTQAKSKDGIDALLNSVTAVASAGTSSSSSGRRPTATLQAPSNSVVDEPEVLLTALLDKIVRKNGKTGV